MVCLSYNLDANNLNKFGALANQKSNQQTTRCLIDLLFIFSRLLSYKELKKAMQKLFVELAHPLLKRVLHLTGFDPSAKKDQSHLTNMDDEEWKKKLKIDRRSFVNLCALANRIICRETKM